MNRQLLGLIAASVVVSTASAVTFHTGIKSGVKLGDPNDFSVESWDFGINMEDPDEWLFSSLNASIVPEFVGLYSFETRSGQLDPPRTPVSQDDIFTSFFSTAQQFPNVDISGPATYGVDLSVANRNELDVFWTAGDAADGQGPEFVLFRAAVRIAPGQLGLTLTPRENSELVATISGNSTTSIDGETPLEFNLYTVPEPGSLLLLSCGLLALRRRG